MATFDLTTKAGFPDFIDSVEISYSSISPGSYSKSIIVDTHFANSFLFETSVKTESTASPDTVTVTGSLSLKESDSPTTGFVAIPTDRMITGINEGAFNLNQDYSLVTINQTSRVGAYGNKRYVEIGIAVNSSRSDGVVSNLFVGTIYRKDPAVSPYSYLRNN